MTSPDPPQTPPAASPDPAELLRSRNYLALLLLGAIAGVPVAAVAFFFLKAVAEVQQYAFQTLPDELGSIAAGGGDIRDRIFLRAA